jgi:hypothetical protein
MLQNTGYGPSFRRRGSGNMLTHAIGLLQRITGLGLDVAGLHLVASESR